MYDPFVALTAAASVTSTLLMGTGVALLAQRDPMALRDEFAPGTPVSMFAVGSKNEALLQAYAEAGVERITLLLGTRPEAETLSRLDALVEVVEKYR